MQLLSDHIHKELENKQIQWSIHEADAKRIPKKKPFILLANHLVRGIDELLVAKLLTVKDLDFKILSLDAELPELVQSKGLQRYGSPNRPWEDPFNHWIDLVENSLDEKDNLIVFLEFPVSRIGASRKRRNLEDFLDALRRLNRPICPVRLHWPEAPPFNSRINSRIIQTLKPGNLEIELRVGNPISIEDQARVGHKERFRKFLQSKIFALGTSLEVKPFFSLPFRDRTASQEPIAAPTAPELIEQDIQSFTYANLIASRGDYDILLAGAHQIPNVLQEIGRLRELTFRQVGEGSGKARDLDEFDLYYDQLIIWDRVNKKIVGGYRMGKGDEIFMKMGVEGFYIHSLFRIQRGFFPIMRKAVELGRSYIVPAYQKKRLPLFLLWKGILYFLLANPQYRYLYGPMSISKHYSHLSKSLIVAFIKKYYYDETLAEYLKPRKPFRAKVEKVDLDILMEHFGSEMKLLDNFIADIEPEHFRIPVLMRQYIKLNARFISFNVDPNFSDVLDGFILLDLQDVPYSMIEALKKEGQ